MGGEASPATTNLPGSNDDQSRIAEDDYNAPTTATIPAASRMKSILKVVTERGCRDENSDGGAAIMKGESITKRNDEGMVLIGDCKEEVTLMVVMIGNREEAEDDGGWRSKKEVMLWW